jgi:hypothetical protein
MQPKWTVISSRNATILGEFASRYAAMLFAERSIGKEGPCTIIRKGQPKRRRAVRLSTVKTAVRA